MKWLCVFFCIMYAYQNLKGMFIHSELAPRIASALRLATYIYIAYFMAVQS